MSQQLFWNFLNIFLNYLEDKEFAVLLDENNSCLIPNEVLVSDRFEVSLTGLENDMLIKTTKVKVKQEVV